MRAGRTAIFRPFSRAGLIATLAVIAVLGSSSSAAAATVIGQAVGNIPCNFGVDFVQMASPIGYSVPTGGGPITDWSTFAGPDTGPVALEVWHPTATAGTYTLVDISPLMSLVPNSLNNFHLVTPIVAQANDVIGLRLQGYHQCVQFTNVLTEQYGWIAQAIPAKSSTAVMRAVPFYRLNVSATVNGATPPPGGGDGQDATGDGQYGSALAH